MRNLKSLLLYGCVGFSLSLIAVSCDKDDDNGSNSNSSVLKPSSNVSKPSLESNLTNTTDAEVMFRCRFDNGGDTQNNMNCTVHWGKYSSRPSTTPKASDLSHHESMRIYANTTKCTTFDKTHTGFSGGTYVYYYFECKNSKYTTKTNVTYCIVKR